MPLFRITINLFDGKHICEFREVPNIDLDTYFLETLAKCEAQFKSSMTAFDIVQISTHSTTAANYRAQKPKEVIVPYRNPRKNFTR